ncbi:rRNA maturation RNase YbeY [Buchnera aphidicola (Astegopteryx bambusae)]|uniref:rRNA maturation RNase YbeY n=1 Tax=Buchnera aphidicola TaxID=9 RepID=UPI0031B864E6
MSKIKINIIKKYHAKHFYPKKKNILNLLKRIFNKDVEINIIMIKKSDMKKLNYKYKKKKKSVNILSFKYKTPQFLQNNFIGEIIICNSIIYEESIKKQKKLIDYWNEIIVHGASNLLTHSKLQKHKYNKKNS